MNSNDNNEETKRDNFASVSSRASFKSLASGVRKHSYIVLVLGTLYPGSLHSVAVYLESKSSTFTKFKSSKVLSL